VKLVNPAGFSGNPDDFNTNAVIPAKAGIHAFNAVDFTDPGFTVCCCSCCAIWKRDSSLRPE